MPTSFVSRLGKRFLASTHMWLVIATILRHTIHSFIRLRFLNRAIFRVTVKQCYFTIFEALPIVCMTALIVGSFTVDNLLSVLTRLNSYDQIGIYLVRSITNELAPLLCTMILLLRSGSAVLSEIALMKINRETETLSMLGIPMEHYLYLPRLVAFALAGPSLTIVFSLVALLGGFFTLGYFHNITFDNYIDQILNAITLKDLLPLIFKPFLMSLAVVLIAIEKGITVRNAFTEVPIKLIHGMMHTVGCVILIEIVFNLL